MSGIWLPPLLAADRQTRSSLLTQGVLRCFAFVLLKMSMISLESQGIFQEKDGFFWTGDGHPAGPGGRLEFKSIGDIGIEAYRAVMAPCGKDTLDRNDRYYWTGCVPDNWAAQMTEYL